MASSVQRGSPEDKQRALIKPRAVMPMHVPPRSAAASRTPDGEFGQTSQGKDKRMQRDTFRCHLSCHLIRKKL